MNYVFGFYLTNWCFNCNSLMPKSQLFKNEIGKKYGSLRVVSYSHRGKYHHEWSCVCDCGNYCITSGTNLREGGVLRCKKCKFVECGLSIRKHGEYAKGKLSPTFSSYKNMLKRCRYPKDINYANYGGRGIKVCDEWDSFEQFLLDMGERPDGCSLDRIDVDKDYSKDNCRWSDHITQSNNKRGNLKYSVAGNVMTVAEIARKFDIPYMKVYHILVTKNSSVEDFLIYVENKEKMK